MEISESVINFVDTLYQFEDVRPDIFEGKTRKDFELFIQCVLNVYEIINAEMEEFLEGIKNELLKDK